MTNSDKKKTKVLFVCIGNMCRSPMAEGFARALGDDVVEAYSAGIHPTGVVSEDAIMMMEERGIDISQQRSKGFESVPLGEIDIIVSMAGYRLREILAPEFRGMCAEWSVDDPIGRSVDTFRRVRDEIEEKVEVLLEEIRNANYSSRS